MSGSKTFHALKVIGFSKICGKAFSLLFIFLCSQKGLNQGLGHLFQFYFIAGILNLICGYGYQIKLLRINAEKNSRKWYKALCESIVQILLSSTIILLITLFLIFTEVLELPNHQIKFSLFSIAFIFHSYFTILNRLYFGLKTYLVIELAPICCSLLAFLVFASNYQQTPQFVVNCIGFGYLISFLVSGAFFFYNVQYKLLLQYSSLILKSGPKILKITETHISVLINTINGYAITLILIKTLSVQDLGSYYIAESLSGINALVLTTVNLTYAPVFKKYLESKSNYLVRKTLFTTGCIGFVVSLAVFIFYNTCQDLIFNLFPSLTKNGGIVLNKLCIAQIFNLSCCSVGLLLNLAKMEKYYIASQTITTILTGILFFIQKSHTLIEVTNLIVFNIILWNLICLGIILFKFKYDHIRKNKV